MEPFEEEYVARFRNGIPLATLQRARALATKRVSALFAVMHCRKCAAKASGKRSPTRAHHRLCTKRGKPS